MGHHHHCPPDHFRDVIGNFPTGVAIITTSVEGVLYGMTASSMVSVSLSPPTLLVCIRNGSPSNVAIATADRFVVNILDEDQVELARRFATPTRNKFEGIEIEDELGSCPILSQALGWIECAVIDTLVCGSHTVYLAIALRASARSGAPLVHLKGSFTRIRHNSYL